MKQIDAAEGRTMNAEIERRYISFADAVIELEEDRSAAYPKIRGISPPFNSMSVDLGGFREQFAPTAFDNVVGRHRNDTRGGVDVVALFNHDENQVLGRTTSGTLELNITDRGLAYAITPPDTQLGRDLVTLIRRGDISGASFAFSVGKDGEKIEPMADGVPLRTITNVSQLYDVSVVTRPAYPNSTAAMRSIEAWKAEQAKAEQPVEERAGENADKRRRWSYSLTAAAAKLAAMRIRVHVPRIK